MGWTSRVIGFDSQRWLGLFLFTNVSEWLSLKKHRDNFIFTFHSFQPGCDANDSPPPNSEVKNMWSYTSTPSYIFVVWPSEN